MKDISVKQAVSEIVEYLNQANSNSEALWDILTALRGPDSSDNTVKMATTAKIRHIIGLTPIAGAYNGFTTNDRPLSPALLDTLNSSVGFVFKFGEVKKLVKEIAPDEEQHFIGHITRALFKLNQEEILPEAPDERI